MGGYYSCSRDYYAYDLIRFLTSSAEGTPRSSPKLGIAKYAKMETTMNVDKQRSRSSHHDNVGLVRRSPCGITICVAVLVLFISSASRPVAAQPALENYACGSPNPPGFYDPFGLIWMSDDAIVANGEGSRGETNSTVVGGPRGYYQNEWIHLRYFTTTGASANNHTKYCFRPPATPFVPYFVRGRFLHGAFNGELLDNATRSVQLGIEIDGQNFQTLHFTDSSQNYAFTFILATRKTYMEVCLVRQVGDPFINVLELKEFIAESMYLDTARGDILTVAGRSDFGTPIGSGTFRYPDDRFDRNWPPSVNANTTETPPILLTSIASPISAPAIWNQPPNRAMRNAITCLPTQTLTFKNQGFIRNVTSAQRFIVYLYFAELDHGVRDGERRFDIVVDGAVVEREVDVLSRAGGVYDMGVQIILNFTTALETEPFYYTLRPVQGSKYGPILNAAEAIGVIKSVDGGRLVAGANSASNSGPKSASAGLGARVAAGVAVVVVALFVR